INVAAGATLNVTGNETIGSLAGSGAVTLGSMVLTTGGNNASTTFTGSISGTGGSINKSGSGTMALSGSNTYGGATTVSAGKLLIGASLTSSSSFTVESGAFAEL